MLSRGITIILFPSFHQGGHTNAQHPELTGDGAPSEPRGSSRIRRVFLRRQFALSV